MATRFDRGRLVSYQGGPGVGRVGDVDGGSVRVDFFESVAAPNVASTWVPTAVCHRALLEPGTRVYWRNPDTGAWLAGRVKGTMGDEYFVQFPNAGFDFPLPEHELRVRWDRPVRDPVAVLTAGGNESAYFHTARLPLLHNLVDQRGASASISAFLSSAVELYPHQVHAALTVLSDPVQRYLLADEVGLGKTIEAGFIIRQTLVDNPRARIGILAPEQLRRQWVRELREKFFIDDFPNADLKCLAHETPWRWENYRGCDLVVVDEVQRLVQVDDPSESPYRELCTLAHSSPRALLLSATPVMAHYTTLLGMLHLLDPNLYRWTDRTAFIRRYELRSQLADSVYGLDSEFTYLLPSTVEDIRALLPQRDTRFEELSAQVLDLLDDNDEPKSASEAVELRYRIEALRAHISETYRLHRRVIRHRRDKVLQDDPGSDVMPYEVRGRQRPERLLLSSEAHEAAQETLFDWRSAVWNRLLDWGREKNRTAYALVLAVLTSRAGGPAGDLLAALRWRLHRDQAAAERSGLNSRERAVLTTPEVLDVEFAVLAGLEGRLADAQDRDSDLDALVDATLPVVRRSKRTVMFCGAGSLAGDLAASLRSHCPHVHEYTRQVGSTAAEEAVTDWRMPAGSAGAQVLVADDSAEDGLNLQVADTAIHVRLPWSPNQLEQRLGRVDRYRGAELAGLAGPARQYRTGAGDSDESFLEAWTELLEGGYRISSESVSTLQDAIADGLGDIWCSGLEFGPTGLKESAERVRTGMEAAREEIDKMDMLESIHDTSNEGRDIAGALIQLETYWRPAEEAMLRYASNGAGGVKLRHYDRSVNGCKREIFDLVHSRPLLDPRWWRETRKQMTPAMAQGTFNRSAALRAPGTRLFRIGNPLVDALASAVVTDDRGQVSAFQRVEPTFTGDPEAYFGFDYLVEADTTDARALISDRPDAATALRRQADRLLPPFTLKVWISAGSRTPVMDPSLYAWLDRPYSKAVGDRNYNFKRIRELLEIFGGWDNYRGAAVVAEDTCRRHLAKVTDLERKCAQAQHQARQHIAVSRAQAHARKAAGHLVGDSESYLMDVAVADALIASLRRPTVQVVAATCLVRTGIEATQRGV